MKILSLFSALLLVSGTVFSETTVPDRWILIQEAPGGNYEFKPDGNGFLLNLKRNTNPARAAATLVANINTKMPSQDKLLFSCRGRNANPIKLTLILSYRDGKKVTAPFGPAFSISGTGWKNYTLSLDTDFKLGDALYEIRQLKFVANITAAPAGTECGLEIRNIRFASPDDIGFAAKQSEIIVQLPERKKTPISSSALKVFFHLDNEDGNQVFRNRRQTKAIHDAPPPYAGFRALLLKTVEGETRRVSSPAEADVIVYSSTLPDPKRAGEIAEAVKQRGIPLFAASEIADPAIAALLPVTLRHLPAEGLPERKKLDNSATTLLPEKRRWNPASFGIYRDLRLRSGGNVLLKFADGSPAVIQGRAGKGQVIYSTFTPGTELIPDPEAYDRFFLQVLSHLSGKTLSPQEPERQAENDGWTAGAGEENFGRFGIRLGDGLLTENISNTLSVGQGALEYSFDSGEKKQLPLPRWTYRPLNGNGKSRSIAWDWKWPFVGKVELTAECRIPADWNGETILFAAEGGIDDLAEVYFNGQLLGRVTKEMPRYWDRPHRYRIAPERIRFGKSNTIRIVSENLRGFGGFGKCPELTVARKDKTVRTFRPDRASWLGKGGILSCDGKAFCRFDTSLAFPGIRWEIFPSSVHLSLSNLADYAAYLRDGKVRIVDLRKVGEVDGNWDEPWLLLFRDAEEFPLLLVFSRKMETIAPTRSGDQVNGLFLRNDAAVGMVTPLWLTGSRRIDSRSWKTGLPAEILRSIRFWYPKAFRYPVECREFFRLEGERIALKTTYRYRTTDSGDWNVTAKPFAPISPLAWQMRGILTETENVSGTGLITSLGEFALAENSDTAFWSLPRPSDASLSVRPRIKDPSDATATANRIFSEGNRWSAGGRTRFQDWTPPYPLGKNYPECANLSFHAWVMGLNQLLLAPFQLTDENRGAFLNRLRLRYFEPVERFRHKAATRWREEPFSGIRYPIYFSSFYRQSTRYAEGTGTVLDYGDQNETAFLILSMAQQLADRFGQKEFVCSNWNFLKQAARLLLVSDDWGYLSCHCRESGGGAMIDMLNCEYAGMLKLARLAEIAGDEATHRQALYRAARRMVPTLARLSFLEFTKTHRLNAYPNNLAYCVGFKEDGAVYRTKGVAPKEIDLYDMSQGTPEELIELYNRYAPGVSAPYLKAVRENIRKQPSAWKGSLLDILARTGAASPKELRELLTAILGDSPSLTSMGRDWPGITLPAYVNSVLAEIHSAPRIAEARLLNFHDAVYDPAEKTLHIETDALAESSLILESGNGIAQLLVNGKEQTPDSKDGLVRIPLRTGTNRIRVQYR